MLHVLPVAAALSRRNDVRVRLFAATTALAAAASDLMARLAGTADPPKVMSLPWPLDFAGKDAAATSLKLPRLLWWSREMRRCDVLVTAERTSTVLKRLPWRCPPMIHIPHGAGDRAVGFEPRIALFDHVIVAGDKDRDRILATGLMPADRCHVSGYLKISAVHALRGSAAALFGNGRPTVFYNPHFARQLSSWQRFGRDVVEAVLASDQFNLIVAPHVRLFAGLSAAVRADWEAMQVPGKFLFDAGSGRSMDMTYTQAADIYLGDVSSQVYEFAATPRPCVFLDAHGVRWQGNPDYLMWRMGEVVPKKERILPALLEAEARHRDFRDVQRALVEAALGDTGPQAPERAARVILDEINRA